MVDARRSVGEPTLEAPRPGSPRTFVARRSSRGAWRRGTQLISCCRARGLASRACVLVSMATPSDQARKSNQDQTNASARDDLSESTHYSVCDRAAPVCATCMSSTTSRWAWAWAARARQVCSARARAASIGGASAGGGIHAAWRVTAATRPGRQVSALTPVPGRGSRRSTSGVIGRLTKYEHSRARRLWVRAPPRQAAQEATGAAAGGEASERARTWVWLWLV